MGVPYMVPGRLVLQVAKATLGQSGECLGSCSGCWGAGHGVGLMWGERWGVWGQNAELDLVEKGKEQGRGPPEE